ncbi:MAG: BatD family protein [Elusimicrobiaceae bacterium]|nr:BatD family protein [Elusimicrobiaceae bacterium]
MTATVNKKVVSLDDSLSLQVRIEGASGEVKDPILPSLPNFSAYSSGQSQNIAIINGSISSSLVYSYTLVPRFVGQATIGEIRIVTGGGTFTTPPIEVKVIPPASGQGNSSPQYSRQRRSQPARQRADTVQTEPDSQDDSVLVKAFVNKKQAYVNEQITLTVRFYTSVQLLGNPEYTPPETKSFLAEDLPPMRSGEEVIDGRTYAYTEIKTALFGATPGTTQITPAQVRYQVRAAEDLDPFSPNFLQNFIAGNMGRAAQIARTKPISVEIIPFPESGKPADFSGLAGSCSMKSAVDRRQLKVGEAANLAITVEGVGNIKSIVPPQLPKMNAFKTYDLVTSLDISKVNDSVQGKKTFKTVIIPRMSGPQTIPPITLSYFNTSTRRYETVQTAPIQLTVEQGTASPDANQVFFTGNNRQQGPGVKTIAEDVAYIRNGAPSLFTAFLTKSAENTSKTALPAALLLLAAGIRLLKGGKTDESRLRRKKALSSARQAVKNSETLFMQSRPIDAVEILSDALDDYLCNKLNCPLGGKTFRQTLALIKEKFPAVRKELLDELESFQDELEQIRFAPGSGQTVEGTQEPISVRMLTLLEQLEKELKK